MANRVQNYLTLLPTISRMGMWVEKKESGGVHKLPDGCQGMLTNPTHKFSTTPNLNPSFLSRNQHIYLWDPGATAQTPCYD